MRKVNLRCGNPTKKVEIEAVNTLHRTTCRAAEQQNVVNFRAAPSTACHRVERLQIVLLAEGYDLKIRQDVLGDNARRFNRVDARMEHPRLSAGP